MSDSVELHPLVKEVAKALTLDQGRVVLAGADFRRFQPRFAAVQSAAEKKEVAQSAVALALQLKGESPEGTRGAVGRIAELAAAVIGDTENARRIFAEAGIVSDSENEPTN